MSWTEERVERMSALWLEGRSASQIAAELGGGISRNAVIGKVHRMGLAGRAAPPAAEAPPPRARGVPPRPAAPSPLADEVAALFEEVADPIEIDLPALGAAGAEALPGSDRVTLLELSGSMCRWPIGDPTNSEFRFCGCRSLGALPYCAEHARVAFQPVHDRRRVERMIRFA